MIGDQQPDYNLGEGTDAGFSPIDGFPQQHIALPPPWPAGFNESHLAQNGFMMDGPNLGVQQPPQGPDYNLHACRRGVQRFPGPESTYQPHHSITQSQSTAPVPENSPQAEANHSRNWNRSKPKQKPTPYERGPGGKRRRSREKKPRDPATLEHIPVCTPKCSVACP
jgi:hypothetical protein